MEQIRKTIKVSLNNIIRDASIALEMRDYEELSELEQDIREYLATESDEVIRAIKKYVYKYVDIKDNKELYEYFVEILGV